VILPPSTVVFPGNSFTFSAYVTAPATPGPQLMSWRMVEDGVEWFGGECNQWVTVVAPRSNSALCTGVVVPTLLSPGQVATATITMQNAGTTTWIPVGKSLDAHSLGSWGPPNNTM